MFPAITRWLSSAPTPRPRAARPRFRPTLQALDDRITPTLNFAAQQTFAAGTNPSGVAVADFNGDGRADFATANQGDSTVSVCLNTTTGTAPAFAARQTFAAGSGPTAIAAGDFDGDGRADLVATNAAAGTVSVLRNTTSIGAAAPSFAPRVGFATTPQFATGDAVVTDVNADGRPDIALIVKESANGGVYQLGVLMNSTAAGATVPSFASLSLSNEYLIGQIKIDPGLGKLVAGDFNGDGRPDFAYMSQSNRPATPTTYGVNVALNVTATGATQPAFYASGAVSDSNIEYSYDSNFQSLTDPAHLAVGDFNADGRQDLLVTYDGNSAGVLLLCTATAGATYARFEVQTSTGLGRAFSAGPITGDFDGDGRTDFAFANAASKTVSALANVTPTFTPSPTFAAPVTSSVGTTPASLATADFNGDGRMDVAVANAGDGTISVLANTSVGGTVTGPSLIGRFGAAGVWRLNRTTSAWDQITAANADSLAVAANGNVVASFGGNGLWYFNPAHGWYQIHTSQPVALAIDGSGNVAASFAGHGTYLYRPSSGWSSPLTSIAADKLAMNAAGQLVAQFPGYGLYAVTHTLSYNGVSGPKLIAGWTLLSSVPVAALAVGSNGDVAASFAGYGVNLYRESTGWTRINGVDATSLAIDGGGSVIANFPGYGVGKYIRYANGWQIIAPAAQAASVAADVFGHAYAAFDGYGVWEYSFAYGWQQRRGNSPSTFAVG